VKTVSGEVVRHSLASLSVQKWLKIWRILTHQLANRRLPCMVFLEAWPTCRMHMQPKKTNDKKLRKRQKKSRSAYWRWYHDNEKNKDGKTTSYYYYYYNITITFSLPPSCSSFETQVSYGRVMLGQLPYSILEPVSATRNSQAFDTSTFIATSYMHPNHHYWKPVWRLKDLWHTWEKVAQFCRLCRCLAL